MNLIQGINSRRSCRGFVSDPIPDDILDKILEAASQSPSYQNTQPWEAAVVTGASLNRLRTRLYDLASRHEPIQPDIPKPGPWPPEHGGRSKTHGKNRFTALNIQREDEQGREGLRLLNFEFYSAPCAVFLFMDSALGEWSVFDMGLFAENLILAARFYGVESCLQASVTDYAPQIKEFLDLPPAKKLVIGICLGYPDNRALLNSYRAVKQDPSAFTKRYQ